MKARFLARARKNRIDDIKYQFQCIPIALKMLLIIVKNIDDVDVESIKNKKGKTIGYSVEADEEILLSINNVWLRSKYHISIA